MNKIKQKTYMDVLIAIAVVFALLYFGNVYLVKQEENLSLEITNKKQKIEQLRRHSEQIVTIRNAYKDVQEKIDKVHSSIVDYSEIVNFIVEVENVAKKNGIELDINVANKEKGSLDKNFSYTFYKIRASGNFSDTMKFLSNLENLRYYSDIENIKILSNKELIDNKNQALINLDADLKVYIYNDDGENEDK